MSQHLALGEQRHPPMLSSSAMRIAKSISLGVHLIALAALIWFRAVPSTPPPDNTTTRPLVYVQVVPIPDHGSTRPTAEPERRHAAEQMPPVIAGLFAASVGQEAAEAATVVDVGHFAGAAVDARLLTGDGGEGATAGGGFGTDVRQPTAGPIGDIVGTVGTVGGFGLDATAPAASGAADGEREAEIIGKPIPAYTPEARAHGITGQVTLLVTLLSTGHVRVDRVLSGLPYGLDREAIAAVSRLTVRPATRAGRPVDTTTTLIVIFNLAR